MASTDRGRSEMQRVKCLLQIYSKMLLANLGELIQSDVELRAC